MWVDESATQAFARALAQQPALCNSLLALHGTLGAGKTTLVRHLLHALGVHGRIKSPTYAVLESYELPATPQQGLPLSMWHFDFYRLQDPQECEDAGFREIFASPGLKLVEWPEQAAGFLPQADLDIHIEPRVDGARAVRLLARSDTGAALLAAVDA